MLAAIAAANKSAQVTIIEKNMRLGKKILATGNGRCNLSNAVVGRPEGIQQYNHPKFVTPVLERYDCTAIRSFFNDMGLMTVVDKKGWVFPRTQTANTVLDVLVQEIDRLGINVQPGQEVVGLRLVEDRYKVESTGGGYTARALVLSCGVIPLLKAFESLNLVNPEPILGPLRTETDSIRGLDGVRVVCRLFLMDGSEGISWQDGELLFRDFGVSGIAVFNLSRLAKPGYSLYIDFFPDLDKDQLESLLNWRWETNRRMSASALLVGMLHTRIIQAVLRKAAIRPTDELGKESLKDLVSHMKGFHLFIKDGPPKDQGQVMRGGLGVEGFDPVTLAAYYHQGVFAAGECLDVDGPCGGFNLHWAWASGLVAGESAALLTRSS
jgi:predicted Rossmann fold flavoprotein